MADYKLIPIAEINVPERLRAVEDDHARAIQASIAERGLLNPITVRATPAAKGGKYTLVAGAHRLRAVSLNGSSEIEAIVVVADKEEAVLIEVEENLFRNDLSALDRAIFVQTHREVWERKYGKIEPGRGNGAKLAQFLDGKPDAAFSDHVAEMRMAIILGDRLLPEVLKLADHLGQLVDRFSEFAAANPELTGAIVKTIAALMAFSIGARLIAFAVAAVRLPLVKLLGFFLKFNEAGRNVALGWRIISGSIRGVGSAAGLARRGVEGLISKVGGLPNALRAGLAASWVIPLAFEFFDDMGRTPEERLEQIRQNQAAFKKLEEDVEQSSFGKLWKSVKDWSNEQMGMEAGAVPAEVLLARITEGWGEVEKWYAQATIDVDKWAADLFEATSGFAVDALNGTLAGLTEGWTQLETWVQSKVEWLKNAFSFEFKMPSLPSWITGGSPEDAAAQKRSAAISGRAATANAADAGQSAGGGAFDQMLAGMDRAASQASDGLARGGTAVEQGGQKAATALEQGAAQSAAMLKEAARAIGNAASRLSAQPGRASAGGSVGSSIATARTGALHGGTE